MAGGPNAQVIPCLRCRGRALRLREGVENDYYRCDSCGVTFGIDWATTGAPDTPQWPALIEGDGGGTKRLWPPR